MGLPASVAVWGMVQFSSLGCAEGEALEFQVQDLLAPGVLLRELDRRATEGLHTRF